MGEYVGRIYDEVKRRPPYIVESSLGFDPSRLTRPRRGRSLLVPRSEWPLAPIAILAGGLGTPFGRMDPATRPRPRCSWRESRSSSTSCDSSREHGAERIVLCVGYLGEQIEAAVGDGRASGSRCITRSTAPSLVGTAGRSGAR